MLSKLRRHFSPKRFGLTFGAVALSLFIALALTGCDLATLLTLALVALSYIFMGPSGFQDTGQLSFFLQPEDTGGLPILSGLNAMGLKTEIDKEDGTSTECKFVDERTVRGSASAMIGLLIDSSATMGEADCSTCPHDPSDQRAQAVERFATTLLQKAPESRVSLAEFGPGHTSEPSTALRVLSTPTQIAADISSAAAEIGSSPDADSPLWDALALTIEGLDASAPQRYVLVLSDGGDDGSTLHTAESVTTLAKERGVVVHVIGLGPASSSTAFGDDSARFDAIRTLQRLADATGGGYASAATPQELSKLYENIAEGITEGLQVVTYDCRDDQGQVPATGSHIKGRFLLGENHVPFEFFSP